MKSMCNVRINSDGASEVLQLEEEIIRFESRVNYLENRIVQIDAVNCRLFLVSRLRLESFTKSPFNSPLPLKDFPIDRTKGMKKLIREKEEKKP